MKLDKTSWVSVEFENDSSNKRQYPEALGLLGAADERYDLVMADGRTVARGIFRIKDHAARLAVLTGIACRWKSTRVYVNGRLYNSSETDRLRGLLNCADQHRPCASTPRKMRLAFLGCHLEKIGFLAYTRERLEKGRVYWFSYYRCMPGHSRKFILDCASLRNQFCSRRCCPYFPPETDSLIDSLPGVIDLSTVRAINTWGLSKGRTPRRQTKLLPQVVPYNEQRYRQFMRKLIDENTALQTVEPQSVDCGRWKPATPDLNRGNLDS